MITDSYLFSTITINHTSNIDDFIEQWSGIYDYQNMDIYERVTSKFQLVKNDIDDIFQWKNGMPLSDKKAKIIEQKIYNKVDIINQLKQKWNQLLFEEHFDFLSAIWRIFLMHIINPNELPIFDQHVYRAYKYIAEHEKYGKFKAGNNLKMELYHQKYLPFHLNLKEHMSLEFTNKQLDNALWSFGKFLNKYDKLIL